MSQPTFSSPQVGGVVGPQHPQQPQPTVAPAPEFPSSSNVALLSDMSLSAPPEVPTVPMPGTQVKPPSTVRASDRDESQQRAGADLIIPPPQTSVPTVKTAEPVDIPVEILTNKIATLESFLAALNNKSVEDLWKDICLTGGGSVSVARCYPFSNRAPDVLPYDLNRVVLQDCRDDYINASKVNTKDPGHNLYIVSQAPLAKQLSEFWSMVWQEGTETVVCLATEVELAELIYFPKEKGGTLKEGSFSVSCQSSRDCQSHTERVLNLTNSSTGQTRALIHLQIHGWHLTEAIVDTAEAMARLRCQQRYSSKPVLVHCLDGGSRSGTFLTINSWLQEKSFDEGQDGLPEIKSKIQNLLTQRKGIIRDKMVLKHIYEILLFAMKRIISKDNKVGTVPMAEHVTPRKISEPDFVGLTVASLKEELQKDTTPEILQEKTEILDIVVKPVDTGKSSNLSQIDLSQSPNSNIPSDLTQLADLADLSLTETKTKKITKEDFFSPSKKVGATNNESDPLSQLDPLWSMK